jgi:ankyrin repeat protein
VTISAADAADTGASPRQKALGQLLLDAVARGKDGAAEALSLIAQGAGVNEVDDFGNHALNWAAARNQQAVVQALLAAGADANARDARGNTPLMSALESSYIKVAKLLVEAGADVTLTNDRGQTATDLSHARHHEKNAKLVEAWAEAVRQKPVFLAWLKEGLPAQAPVRIRAPLKLKTPQGV